ncbi:hypothetical protein Tco_0747658 [Tanacetum coccineum]|uniref:Retrovirus-related Pol polyprotein from transposon TNT 1-94-like beta-barrel domain-containing protein n=1 Tax=Tanacetum coccineum TaxID=301880 RepID=A0ABQ4YW76_9ASTR
MSGSQDEIPPPPPPPPSSPQTPTQQTPHTLSTIKLSILKKGEYDIWAMKMEHYLAHTDYPIWEVIQNRNGPVSIIQYTKDKLSCPQLDHEDLEQLDEYDLEEMDLKWQVAMISMRMKKFYKKTDNRRRDAWNSGNKDGSRTGKKEDSKALVTIDGEGVDWTSHSKEDEDYALMACNSSESDTEVTSCSNKCKESYANLKKLYDAQREQLSDASIEIKAYSQGLKKVEAQLVVINKVNFEAQKEKEDLKAKVEKWHNSSKNLSKLLNTQMSANDKFGLGYGDHRYDWFVTAGGMHACTPPMTGNYMPSDLLVSGLMLIIEEYESDSEDEYLVLLVEKGKLLLSPQRVVIGDHKDTTGIISPNTMVDPVLEIDYPHRALKNKGIVDSGCSRHMTGNKAYLAEFQDFNGGPVAFGGSKTDHPRPSPSTTIPDSIPKSSGGNLGGHSSNDKSLSWTEGEMTLQSVYDLCLSLCAHVSDHAKEIQNFKGKYQKGSRRKLTFSQNTTEWMKMSLEAKFSKKEFLPRNMDAQRVYTLDYMETEDAQDVGRTRDAVDEEKENDEDALSTEDVTSVLSSTKKLDNDKEQSTDEHTEEGRATQTTQPPHTSIIFGDDETIAKVLLNMSQAKAVSREEGRKGRLASDEEMARKVQEWKGEEERNKLAKKTSNDYHKQIMMNKRQELKADSLPAVKASS